MANNKSLILKRLEELLDKKNTEALKETFPFISHPDSSETVWESKDGRRIKIKDMATTHIINCVNMLERNGHVTHKKGSDMYHALVREIAWRIERTNEQKGKKTKRKMNPGGIFFAE